jgi:hypothetical protein
MIERCGMQPVVRRGAGDGPTRDLKLAAVVIDATTTPASAGGESMEYFEIATAYCGDVEHSFRLTSNAPGGSYSPGLS